MAPLVLLELLLVLLALFVILRNNNYSIPDSFSYCIVLLFLIYSVFIQLFFIMHIIRWFFVFDFMAAIVSTAIIIKHKNTLIYSFRKIIEFIGHHKNPLIPFVIVYIYLFFQVLLLPPREEDALIYNLPRVLMMIKEDSLFLNNFNNLRQVNFPIGFDILNFLFLRLSSDWFLSLFSYLSYFVIINSTFSLVKKLYDHTKLSILIALMISSLIMIVLQSTTARNDIPTAAIVTFCFLTAYNLISYAIFSAVLCYYYL
jgi:hypothetical protein